MNKAVTGILKILILVFMVSCAGRSEIRDERKVETPRVLQDDKLGLKSYTRRSGENLVDQLYSDLVDKSSKLKKLEEELGSFLEKSQDLTEQYDNYDDNSKSYYNSANLRVSSISDSLLKRRIISLIMTSKDQYSNKTSELNKLIDTTKKSGINLTDHHAVLKIVLTLPIIEKYQLDNLPDEKEYKELILQQAALIRRIDSLALN